MTENTSPRDFLTDRAQEVFQKALKHGILYITGEIEEESIYFIYDPLLQLIRNPKIKKIQVVINSQGGDSRTGLTIAQCLANSRKQVETRVVGQAESAAASIFLGGHRRVVSPGSELMFHDSWVANFDGATGEHSRRIANMHEKFDKEQVAWIVERTGLDPKFVEEQCSKDHWHINAKEALEFGMATHED
jgi:ATP-dependent protease ClpP protease subunit